MSDSVPMSPRVWIAAITALCLMATLAVSLLTVGGAVLAIGIWKGGIDNRVSSVEMAIKEQIAALAANTDKQVLAVANASKDMVAALKESTDKRLTDIERDRASRIEESSHWRAEQSEITTRQETLITQQKQIDLLMESTARQHPNRP